MTCFGKYQIFHILLAQFLHIFTTGRFLEGVTIFQDKIRNFYEEITHFLFKGSLELSERRYAPVPSV